MRSNGTGFARSPTASRVRSGSRAATCARSAASTRRSGARAGARGTPRGARRRARRLREAERPSFQLLQRRMHLGSATEVRRRMRETPVTYVIFDLLHLDGRTLFDLPYEAASRGARVARARRPELADARVSSRTGPCCSRRPVRGVSRVVAKRLQSPYRPGRRTRDWIKIKNVRSQELVIGGWLPAEGERLGSLLSAAAYAGRSERASDGLADADLRLLRERPADRRQSPFGPPAAEGLAVRRAATGGRGGVRR